MPLALYLQGPGQSQRRRGRQSDWFEEDRPLDARPGAVGASGSAGRDDHDPVRPAGAAIRALRALVTLATAPRRRCRPGRCAPGASSSVQDPTIYTCPMHPGVKDVRPGNCTSCGMPLVTVAAFAIPSTTSSGSNSHRRLPVRGEGDLRFLLFHPETGAQIKELNVVHGMPFHLFVVSRDLRSLSAHSPDAATRRKLHGRDGSAGTGPYEVFCDLFPVGGNPQVIHRSLATVDSPPLTLRRASNCKSTNRSPRRSAASFRADAPPAPARGRAADAPAVLPGGRRDRPARHGTWSPISPRGAIPWPCTRTRPISCTRTPRSPFPRVRSARSRVILGSISAPFSLGRGRTVSGLRSSATTRSSPCPSPLPFPGSTDWPNGTAPTGHRCLAGAVERTRRDPPSAGGEWKRCLPGRRFHASRRRPAAASPGGTAIVGRRWAKASMGRSGRSPSRR